MVLASHQRQLLYLLLPDTLLLKPVRNKKVPKKHSYYNHLKIEAGRPEGGLLPQNYRG